MKLEYAVIKAMKMELNSEKANIYFKINDLSKVLIVFVCGSPKKITTGERIVEAFIRME